MMHWKGFGMKELWPNQGTVRYFSGGFDKSNDNIIRIGDDCLKI